MKRSEQQLQRELELTGILSPGRRSNLAKALHVGSNIVAVEPPNGVSRRRKVGCVGNVEAFGAEL
jgi:hypothetical protein